MALNTYVPLYTQVIGTPVATVTFSSIPATYTDLVVEINCGISTTGQGVALSFNGTSTGYSNTFMYKNVSAVGTSRTTSQTNLHLIDVTGNGDTTIKTAATAHIQSYSSGSVNKTILYTSQNDATIQAGAGRWANNAVVTDIAVGTTGGNFVTGSIISIYGIQAFTTDSSPKATGGNVSSNSTHWYHAFPYSGTFTLNTATTADILVIGGGGGGGSWISGGGGAGMITYLASKALTAGSYTVTIGAGGVGGLGTANDGLGQPYHLGYNGGNSYFAFLQALGGGGGAGNGTGARVGLDGGSGGGGSQGYEGGRAMPIAANGASYYGFDGGTGVGGSNYCGGGGGGAGQRGGDVTSNEAGGGGAGLPTWSDWGIVTGLGHDVAGVRWFGGGGGGFGTSRLGQGGNGGGGFGTVDGGTPTPGLPATGGGGGAIASAGGQGANGGSGVVIVRYAR
ncbi:hypothetical protein UFOVP655_87 [uncultured Caudovirales phage]|uniref:Glycine-rich domain-containing protein n=1 Tax=uncultured Caudovirales phage TaxID=2100421 RepID=A0A6J5NDB7_9CAUD|nr:hypothetical protein UFOVP655_87 [uncultured Caudovirales phage]